MAFRVGTKVYPPEPAKGSKNSTCRASFRMSPYVIFCSSPSRILSAKRHPQHPRARATMLPVGVEVFGQSVVKFRSCADLAWALNRLGCTDCPPALPYNLRGNGHQSIWRPRSTSRDDSRVCDSDMIKEGPLESA